MAHATNSKNIPQNFSYLPQTFLIFYQIAFILPQNISQTFLTSFNYFKCLKYLSCSVYTNNSISSVCTLNRPKVGNLHRICTVAPYEETIAVFILCNTHYKWMCLIRRPIDNLQCFLSSLLIRSVSEKYPTYLHVLPRSYSTLAYDILRSSPHLVNNTLPMPFPLLKIVLVLDFWYRVWSVHRISFNRLYIVKSSFKGHFQFWKQSKVAGSYIRTVQSLMQLYNTMFCQILLYEVWCMCWCIIVVKQSISTCPNVRSFSYCITQYFRNL